MSTQRDGFYRLIIFLPPFNLSAAVGPASLAPPAASPPAIYDLDPIEPRRESCIRS